MDDYKSCRLCPRQCGVNRYEAAGFCGMGAIPAAARASLHKWEEPCISVTEGAGTVFFSGCSLRCVFCQNHIISAEKLGRELTPAQLGEIYLRLQDMGADNIELVTASHFLPSVIRSLDLVKQKLTIPVIYNSGGYETVDSLRRLDGYIDVYLPDLKYFSPEIAKRYSAAPDYFEYASAAVEEMHRQTGNPEFSANGAIKRGTIIRHLVLPSCRHDSMRIMDFIASRFKPDEVLVSIMNQYTPFDHIPEELTELKRRVTKMEYNSVVKYAVELGIKGYTQGKAASDEKYVPDFEALELLISQESGVRS